MANVFGVNLTKFNAPGDANWIDQGLIKSDVKVWTDTYEAVAVAIGQTIGFAELPAGAVVVDVILLHDALGAVSTLAIGDSTSSGRYIAATSTVASGRSSLDQIDGNMFEITSDGEIIATVAGGAVTGTIKLVVLYTN